MPAAVDQLPLGPLETNCYLLRADGAAPEDVFDPRAISATGMTRDELPGYRAPKGTDVYAPAPVAPAKK